MQHKIYRMKTKNTILPTIIIKRFQMFKLKKLQILLLATVLLLFSGCIRGIGTNGLTLKINPSDLNMQEKKFPIVKDFTLAKVFINKPTIGINKTNQITALVDLKLSAIFVPESNATLDIAGEPYFDKEKSAIFLKNVVINKMTFKNNELAESFSADFIPTLAPLFDEVFKSIPVYTIKKDSFRGSFVKDVKIENSELLVTFGL